MQLTAPSPTVAARFGDTSAGKAGACRPAVHTIAARLVAPRRGALATLTLLSVAACADFEGAVNPSYGLPDVVVEAPTLSRDVQPILDKRCAFGGCHSAASRQGGLSLVAGTSHAALVGRPARLNPGDTLVIPGASSRSWLYKMLGDNSAARFGVSRMPLAATPLTANQLATIARWIDRGAPRE